MKKLIIGIFISTFLVNILGGSFVQAAGIADISLASEYQTWKQRFVSANGAPSGSLRVIQPENDNVTVSEAQGYGMLLALYNDDRDTFEKLWRYVEFYKDERGLMHWKIDKSGVITGKNAATDADEDIGYALLAASKRWKVYETEARAYINAIYTYEVELETYVLKPGDVWGGSDATNPSYYAPAYYREFARFTQNEGWYKVIETCYEIMKRARHPETGLLPEWTTINGTSSERITWNSNKDNFSYNAIRVPWRIALDWIWSGDPRAMEVMDPMMEFFANEEILRSGYRLDGAPIVNYFDAAFAAGIAAGSKASKNPLFTAEMAERLVSMTTETYYGASLRLLALLLVTNNFPNYGIVFDILPVLPPDETEFPALIEVEHPKDGGRISGEKKLKIFVEDVDPDIYRATYEVDSQGEKEMEVSGKYHQAKIIFDDWIWNGEGPYTIVYRIYNSSGEQTAQKTVRLFVKH